MKLHTILGVWLATILSPQVEAEEYAVVVHPDSTLENLSSRELISIFKAEKQSWGWSARIFLILPKSSTEEHAFLLDKVYSMSDADLSRYWIELQYRNKISARPKSLARGALTISVVRKKKGAIALMRVQDLPGKGRVKALKIDGLLPGARNYPLRDGEVVLERLQTGTAPASGPRLDDRDDLEERLARLEGLADGLLETSLEENALNADFDQGPTLELHGFGHVEFAAEDGGARTDNQFALGGLDLFIQSRLSERLSFLSETVFEPTAEGEYVLDVERVILKYDFSDFLSVQAGRFHTTIGHWNEAYHHGEWLQTAIGRPRIFDFEDEDGLLPVHLVGLSLQGRGSAAPGVLDYAIELGNGRGPTPDPPQITVDANDAKALNLAAGFSPARLAGLRLGASAYFDDIPAAAGVHGSMDERILSLFVTYESGGWEALAEAVRIDHDESGGPATDTTGYYFQLGRRFGDLTPYLRLDSARVDDADTFYESNDDEEQYSLGVRWDFAKWSALKLQYDHTEISPALGADFDSDALRLQVSFAF